MSHECLANCCVGTSLGSMYLSWIPVEPRKLLTIQSNLEDVIELRFRYPVRSCDGLPLVRDDI
jgi:hypothetical protein